MLKKATVIGITGLALLALLFVVGILKGRLDGDERMRALEKLLSDRSETIRAVVFEAINGQFNDERKRKEVAKIFQHVSVIPILNRSKNRLRFGNDR